MDSHTSCPEALQLCSTAASLPKTLWVAGLEIKGSEGGTEAQRGCAGSSHSTALCCSHTSKIALPHWPNQAAFLCGTNSNICLQSRRSFVILKLWNKNFNFPALIPTQTKGFCAQCSLCFLAAAWGKAKWKSMLGAVLNYNILFLFMMTCPSVTQLFSVRQERSGSLLIVCQMEDSESSCLPFSTLPLHQFLSQINALVEVGLKQRTDKHGAVPVFSKHR